MPDRDESVEDAIERLALEIQRMRVEDAIERLAVEVQRMKDVTTIQNT